MIPFAPIVTWFLTSKVGRMLAAGFAIAVAIGIAVLKVFNAGKGAERARQDRQSLENLRSRARTDDEVHGRSDDALERDLSHWVRDDEKR